MPIDIIFSPPRPNNPFEIARRELIAEMAKLKVPTIGSWPEPEDFLAVKDHIIEVAQIADKWLAAIGTEIRCNATTNINMDYFASGFSDYGVNGWCLYECDKAAEALESETV